MSRPAKLTQTVLARRLGVSRVTVARWAAGGVPAGFPLANLRRDTGGRIALTGGEMATLLRWAVSAAYRGRRVPAVQRFGPFPAWLVASLVGVSVYNRIAVGRTIAVVDVPDAMLETVVAYHRNPATRPGPPSGSARRLP
jgi:hypothetical protein